MPQNKGKEFGGTGKELYFKKCIEYILKIDSLSASEYFRHFSIISFFS